MSQQLWSSPQTGYRRVGTRIAEISTLIEQAIMVRAIAEPLKSCPFDAGAEEMRCLLVEREFDIAGVQAEKGGPVLGYVEAKCLSGGTVQDCMATIGTELLIADSTPLTKVFDVLRHKSFVFVLTDNHISGLVTRADLNKPPVRVYLFGIISMLEMHLTFWLRRTYGDDDWKTVIKPERLGAAEKLFSDRQQRRHELELWECLQLADKKVLFLANAELLARFGISSKNKTKRLLEDVEKLRNCLAHSQHDLCEGADWSDVIDTIGACAAFLEKSDQIIEMEQATIARGQSADLW